ncbi:hypothetical protein EXN65_16950 [Clostridium botulinum]|uniref:Uncharacterized protein n=1 Tax=Clostridium botulinum TaxID=1491 RepID=A0A846I6W8_CLOBO|nr:hypothetical protein [Clostridium botulinum]NEZ93325.1 hypothetical protein [Clostridium botulinum]NFB02028.1 hypothetical protein [Clostridium botulinum]NFB33279.1 hypothetical protein [Clostridium botulinum]NFE32112.1 hypothetical protein [Clostridium botulinum]
MQYLNKICQNRFDFYICGIKLRSILFLDKAF